MKFAFKTFSKSKTVQTVGSSLKIDLPLLGIAGLKAKVDTGAFNGSLHAKRIREVTDRSGAKRLRFCPLGSPGHTIEVDTYHTRRVKSSNGLASQRYAIDSEISLLGRRYPITLTLTNRSSMKYPMLIGRNFLRLHGFLVDVNHSAK